MAERRHPDRPETATEALLALADNLDPGDPLRDEPASVFVPLAPGGPPERAEPR